VAFLAAPDPMVLPLPAIDFDGRDFRDLKDGEKV
jgi:hypothetical protein